MSESEIAGIVSAATPEAAAAGVEIMEQGGNAIDAAVAVSLALGVTEPAGSGIGGQSTFITYPTSGEPFVINGTSRAPSNMPQGIALSDLTAHRASTVPSNLKVLDFAYEKYGSGRVSWSRLCEPAIRLAYDGYALGLFRHKALLRHTWAIRQNGTATQLLLAPDGSVPTPGELMRNPVLGRTLQRLADHGAEDFYSGEIARQIEEDMLDHEGFITRDELSAVPEPAVLPALKETYRGWDVHTLPPPGGGWVVLLALNILEQIPEGVLAVEGPGRLVSLAETLMAAHRQRFIKPIPDPLNYQEYIGRYSGKEKAQRMARNLPRVGTGETTHFSLVDAQGMVVAVTQSLNAYFGAKVANPKSGFLYNDYMREFVPEVVKHPHALHAGAMPYSSMSASIVARNGKPVMAAGSAGDERIISGVIQVISHFLDVRKGIEAAVAAPRIHCLRVEEVLLETRPQDLKAVLSLEQRGYTVHQPLSSLFSGDFNPYFGGIHAVARQDDQWTGAADPRRDGAVARMTST